MSTQLPGSNPTAYTGLKETNPPQIHIRTRAPVSGVLNKDYANYDVGDLWVDKIGLQVYFLVLKFRFRPTWVGIGGLPGQIETVTGDDTIPVYPDPVGNINITGIAAQGVSTNSPLANTLAITVADATTIAKGVSYFNPLDFTVVNGFVSALHPNFFWELANGTPTAMTFNRGYYTSIGAGPIVMQLPAVCPAGTIIRVVGVAGGWTITQNAAQSIVVGNLTSTPGVGGSVSSTAITDCIELLCTTADTTWHRISQTGNLLVV